MCTLPTGSAIEINFPYTTLFKFNVGERFDVFRHERSDLRGGRIRGQSEASDRKGSYCNPIDN